MDFFFFQKSLFDGLEEDDPSIQKFTLKPSVKRLVLRPKPAADNDNSTINEVSLPYEIIDHHSNNNDKNESSVIVDASPRINSFTPAREVLSPDYISEKDSQRISPSNIQKRVGLDSPRGGILKNSVNVTVTGNLFIKKLQVRKKNENNVMLLTFRCC